MKLKVRHEILTDASTIGSLFVDDQFFCYTLEPPKREDFVGSSRETFHRLFSLLADANERKEAMYISYVDAAESKAA